MEGAVDRRQPFLCCLDGPCAFMSCSCCPRLPCGLPPWLSAFFAVGTPCALVKLPACEVCGMGAHFVHTWLAIPMLARADLSTPACSGPTRLPLRGIDISWVTLCVPMRPGKNSFVMMRGARSDEWVYSLGPGGFTCQPIALRYIYIYIYIYKHMIHK